MVYFKLVLSVLFWGSSFTAGKIAVMHLPVFSVAFYRFFISSIILVGLLFLIKKEKFNKRAALYSFFGGLTGIFFYNYFFLKGLSLTEASRASIIVAINPVITTVLAVFLFKEKLNLKQIIGVIIAFFGMLILVLKGDLTSFNFKMINPGDILILFAALSWSFYTLIGKKILGRATALETTTYSVLWGTVLLLPFFINDNLSGLKFGNLDAWIGILVLSILATVLGFLWFYEGINTLGASKTVVFIYLVPVFGVIVGFFILNEPILLSSIIGGVITIFGVIVTNSKS